MHSTISAPHQTTRLEAQSPSPHRIYDTLLFSHARADALKAAIELDVFSAIGEGSSTIEDIACPAFPAMFCRIMLVSEPGDSYTFADFDEMLRRSGFHHNTASALPPTPQTLILSTKE